MGCFPGLNSILGRGSSARKSNLRLTAGFESAGSGVFSANRDRGAADDCLRGDEPMFVL